MDTCGKNQEKILRLQFQIILNNKKVIRDISNLLDNFVWFSNKMKHTYHFCFCRLFITSMQTKP